MSQAQATGGRLPRLLYVGDIPIANSVAGAVFLYRLLKPYPREKLVVCAPTADWGAPLEGVRYVSFDARWPRLFRTRLSPFYCSAIAKSHDRLPNWARELADTTETQAILTISQTCGWILAWRLAQSRRLPLILLMQDDEVYYRHLPKTRWQWAIDRFGEAYRYASARYCISPGMAEDYGRRFGAQADVLYPLRDAENPVFTEPAPQTSATKTALTFAYAGSVYGEAGIRQLADFAIRAAARGHRLVVYSPQHADISARASAIAGLVVRPPVARSAMLISELREQADCLLLTSSFEKADANAVEMLFPSKLADYSALGLPLIVWAPAQSSVGRYCERNPGLAKLVPLPDPNELDSAIEGFASSSRARRESASLLLEAGRRTFDSGAAWQSFASRLEGLTGKAM